MDKFMTDRDELRSSRINRADLLEALEECCTVLTDIIRDNETGDALNFDEIRNAQQQGREVIAKTLAAITAEWEQDRNRP
jgi:hypothetical protein